MSRSARIPIIALAGLLPLAGAAQVDFPVSFAASAAALDGPQRATITQHVQAAGARWVRDLAISGPRSIEIEIALDPGINTANGGSLTTGFVGRIGERDLFEQGVAFELRTGTDPNGATVDARFTFGTSYLANELWFDPNPVARSAAVPVDRTDAFSVILHEFGHAIAYNGFANLATGVPPPTFFSPFDRWMIPGSPVLFDGPVSVAVWGSRPDLTFNNLFHWGNAAPGKALQRPVQRQEVRWDDGRPVPGDACPGVESVDAPPSSDAPGAKGGAPSLIDELMNGVVFFRGRRYDIGALDLALLEDVGLPLDDGRIFRNGFERP